VVGGVAGGVVGSVIPGAGTALGAAVGGALGAAVGGAVSGGGDSAPQPAAGPADPAFAQQLQAKTLLYTQCMTRAAAIQKKLVAEGTNRNAVEQKLKNVNTQLAAKTKSWGDLLTKLAAANKKIIALETAAKAKPAPASTGTKVAVGASVLGAAATAAGLVWKFVR